MSGVATFEERFWAKVDVRGVDECWPWLGSLLPKGYGTMSRNGSTTTAHRIAYELKVGKIPAGYTIDHLCRNRGCCNPAHLEAVTNKENILRGESFSAREARQTHCKRGHPLTPDNVRMQGPKKNMRLCLECARLRSQKQAAKRKAQRRLAKTLPGLATGKESE